MRRVLSLMVCFVFLVMSLPAAAATYNIFVTPDGDKVYGRQWYYGGSDNWSDVSANPNTVSHSYEPGWGSLSWTALNFDLSSFTSPVTDIVSATLNINILGIWTSGTNDVGVLGDIAVVYADQGTGRKSFDITDSFKNIIAGGGTTANYNFSYTGYSGFSFGSAEGGDPAFLRVTTTGANPVPLPAAFWLLGSGLLGLLGIRRRMHC